MEPFLPERGHRTIHVVPQTVHLFRQPLALYHLHIVSTHTVSSIYNRMRVSTYHPDGAIIALGGVRDATGVHVALGKGDEGGVNDVTILQTYLPTSPSAMSMFL